jgi:hypothetical protein
LEELYGVRDSFKKDKIPDLDGWTIDFYRDFFDLVVKDLVLFLEEIRKEGELKLAFNTTFLTLIPKTDLPVSFEYFQPISLYNSLFKIHFKIITLRLKLLLSNFISHEQFGFLKGRLIYEAIGATQEGLHTIKIKKKDVSVFKIDPSKDFDRVS